MDILFNDIFLQHETGNHPENKKRLNNFLSLPNTSYPNARSYLDLVHTSEYIETVQRACKDGLWLDNDTMTSPKSFDVALAAVGLALRAMEEKNFAVMRPPGHHAYPDKGTGFCLFNTIAIVTQHLVNEGKKVLVFDFDGHLGDGTEAIFYNSNQVLFWSLHQYPAFPGNGYIHEIGAGVGEGFTINVPLPLGSGDDIFMNGIETFLPIATQFKPDVVAVSAGFDAHLYDLLLGLRVTGSSFYKIGQLLRAHFKHVFAVLEGGYNLEYMPKSLFNFVAGINGDRMSFPEDTTSSGASIWRNFDADKEGVIANLKPYWSI